MKAPSIMLSSQAWPYRMVFAVPFIVALALLTKASALSLEYCSDINTSTNSKNISTFQSNGLCQQFCIDDYAFAVLQYNGCWCSDYAPATNTTGCTTNCPGYPSDICGGVGLYGYIALTIAPSGTQGASSTAVAEVTVTASPDPQTIIQTVTESPFPTDVTPTSDLTKSTSTPSAASTLAQTTLDSAAGTQVISVQTVTSGGETITVTPTVPATSSNAKQPNKENNGEGGLSTGAAVGLTIGLVALVVIVASIGYFCWKRHQKERYAAYQTRENGFGAAGVVPSRTMSESSRYVLNTDGHQVVESWEGENDVAGSRRSRLMTTVDPRLDPFAKVYRRAGDSKSRDSVNTIRDDQDYSRRINQPGPILRPTNPDPDTTLDR